MIIEKMDSTHFDWLTWRAGSIKDFNIPSRYNFIIAAKATFREYAVGYCDGESLMCRNKQNHKAVMFFKNGVHFWFHLRNNEFSKIFEDDDE